MADDRVEIPEVPKIEVGELLAMADAAKPFVLLDVRNDDEYESWKLEGEKGRTVLLFLQGTNLLDEEIRVHTSYLKNLAPQMGRSFTAGVRAEF